MHAKKMCIMCNKRGFVINIHSVLRIIYHLLKTQTYINVLITNLHSVLCRIYHQVMCMYAEWCICACTQNGAYVHGRRMVHMCMDAEWCICAWTLNGALLHARRMVHFLQKRIMMQVHVTTKSFTHFIANKTYNGMFSYT